MNYLILFLLLATHPGVWRWSVKTLTDPSAAHLVAVEPATIQALSVLKPPVRLVSSTPRQPAERQVYQVSALLVGLKLEADGDDHLILRDAQGRTMIAEIPNPAYCTRSRYHAEIASARAAFGTRHAGKLPGIPVTVTGPLFFDEPHGQSGHAANYAEIHPVLSFQQGP